MQLKACLFSILATALVKAESSAEAVTSTVSYAGQPSVVTWMKEQATIAPDADFGESLIPSYNQSDPQDKCPGYKADNIKNSVSGVTATLSLAGDNCNTYGYDIDQLNLKVEYQNDHRLSVQIEPAHITEANQSHYQIPPEILPQGEKQEKHVRINNSDLVFYYSNSPSFWFKITRRSTGETIFSTKGSKLIFEDQFLEFKTSLNENHYLFGLGEHIDNFQINPGSVKTLFNADIPNTEKANIYGTHPFYVEERFNETDNSPSSYGVYLRNAHAQEVLVGETSLTWRTIGGSIELYFFSGPSTKEVVKQYQEVVGLPAMHQYWTLGFHQCRWGYHNISELREVVDKYREHGIPLETLWSDIDYMSGYRDFTTDPNTYPQEQFSEFLSDIHKNNQHYVPMVDAAIYIPNPDNSSDSYPTFDRGKEADVFLKNPGGKNDLYIGAVWPGYTVFPDWLAENTQDWWTDELSRFYKDVEFDGIWIDMNEVSSFCVGSCGTGKLHENPVITVTQGDDPTFEYPEGFSKANESDWKNIVSQSSAFEATKSADSSSSKAQPTKSSINIQEGKRNINHPPYAINNGQDPNDMGVHAVSPNATHQNGVVEYDWHNLYGYQNAIATYKALEQIQPGRRPFIISRSSFSGTGTWAGHWGGDNYAKWSYMRYSISQGLSFSLFGIPMFGVDVCGFGDNSDMELCSRWAQLGAFFSFYRNHNSLGLIPQEFYQWGSVEESAKEAMKIRYSLLPYFYTLLEKAHEDGDTFLRALSWEFPYKALSGIDSQFLVGPSLMVIPVLEPLKNTTEGIFPEAVWYDWYNQTKVEVAHNQNVTIDAPLGHIPVYVRGGSVLTTQDPGYTISESREGDFGLIIALDDKSQAYGEVYIDDGESVRSDSTWIEFEVCDNSLTAKARGEFAIDQSMKKFTILGVKEQPKKVKLNDETVKYEYDSNSQILKVVADLDGWDQGFNLSW